jgi:3-hydroxybutyryl-CoA dehydratase
MKGKTIDQLTIGESAQFAKTITESDVVLYAGITGDFNPAHVNEAYAKGTYFKGRIAHGLLAAGLISAALGCRLPGPGTIYLGQSLKFMAPVRIGDTITAVVTVSEKLEDNKRVLFTTTCTNQEGEVVLEGEATVMPPRA